MKIVVSNHSTQDPGYGAATVATLQKFTTALARFFADDFCPKWCLAPVPVRLGADDGADVGDDEWELAIFDTSDVPGAAGYHATDARGRPYGRVFLDACNDWFHGDASVTLDGTHEGAELLVNSGANRWVDMTDALHEQAMEAADRVEDTSYTKDLGDGDPVTLTNFLLPAYFEADGYPGPLDFLGKLTSRADKTPGGYYIERTAGQDPTSVTAYRIVGTPHPRKNRQHETSRFGKIRATATKRSQRRDTDPAPADEL